MKLYYVVAAGEYEFVHIETALGRNQKEITSEIAEKLFPKDDPGERLSWVQIWAIPTLHDSLVHLDFKLHTNHFILNHINVQGFQASDDQFEASEPNLQMESVS